MSDLDDYLSSTFAAQMADALDKAWADAIGPGDGPGPTGFLTAPTADGPYTYESVIDARKISALMEVPYELIRPMTDDERAHYRAVAEAEQVRAKLRRVRVWRAALSAIRGARLWLGTRIGGPDLHADCGDW